jgi:hypothetical protein
MCKFFFVLAVSLMIMSAAESSMHKYFNPKCLRAACLFTNPLLLLAHYITMSNCSQLMFPIVTLWYKTEELQETSKSQNLLCELLVYFVK